MNLSEQLSDLKLYYLANNLDTFLAGFSSKASAIDVITRAAELEMLDKATKSTERRLKSAKIGNFRPIEEFDWLWTKGVDKKKIEQLLALDFVAKKSNIILAGAQGLGKTMIAQNLAYRAATRGIATLFTTASRLILDLSSQETSAALQRRLGFYERLHLLVIDELGYLNFSERAADFIFEIVNRRYEKGSLVITTNLAFGDWHQIFPGAACTTAMIDRLTHHAEILKLTGESFRRREASMNSKPQEEQHA